MGSWLGLGLGLGLGLRFGFGVRVTVWVRVRQGELASIASFLETARHAGSTLKHGALVSWKK